MGKSIDLAASYLEHWQRKDLDGIARHLHPAVHFTGPMIEMNGREGVVAAVARILPLLKDFRVRSTFISGDRAMFTYDFVCEAPVGVCRTAEEVTFEDGLVKTIELFYDPRPFEALTRKAS